MFRTGVDIDVDIDIDVDVGTDRVTHTGKVRGCPGSGLAESAVMEAIAVSGEIVMTPKIMHNAAGDRVR